MKMKTRALALLMIVALTMNVTAPAAFATDVESQKERILYESIDEPEKNYLQIVEYLGSIFYVLKNINISYCAQIVDDNCIQFSYGNRSITTCLKAKRAGI